MTNKLTNVLKGEMIIKKNKNNRDWAGIMTRSELIDKLVERFPNKTPMEIESIVITVFSEISKTLQKHGRVELRGFGSFFVRKRDKRVGCDPRSGKAIQLEDRYAPLFRAGKVLLDKLN
jgi:integration host factor subunit beta